MSENLQDLKKVGTVFVENRVFSSDKTEKITFIKEDFEKSFKKVFKELHNIKIDSSEIMKLKNDLSESYSDNEVDNIRLEYENKLSEKQSEIEKLNSRNEKDKSDYKSIIRFKNKEIEKLSEKNAGYVNDIFENKSKILELSSKVKELSSKVKELEKVKEVDKKKERRM